MSVLIRKCAEPGCPHLGRWAAWCPVHLASTIPARLPSRAAVEASTNPPTRQEK